MSTAKKTMTVSTDNASAEVSAVLNDALPPVPCPGPAGYVYTGMRYVPVFADPIEWSSTNTYEALEIVMHEGNSYTSKTFVPAGIDISNQTYWVKTADYNAQIEQYRKEVEKLAEEIGQRDADYATVKDMVADSSNLQVGDIVSTYGYYAIMDGGGSKYEIVNEEPTGYYVAVGNLFAKALFGEEVSVRQVGAKGNGIDDDTSAIQYAIDNYENILVPMGVYPITNIKINKGLENHVSIKGNGKGALGLPAYKYYDSPVFKGNLGSTVPMFEVSNTRNSIFEGFCIDAGNVWQNYAITTESNIPNCMVLNDSPYNIFNNVQMRGSKNSCLLITGTTYTNTFTDCSFAASSAYGMDTSQAVQHVTEWFYNCRFESNIMGGAKITGTFLSFIGCAFEASTNTGLELGFGSVSTRGITFLNCDIEQNKGTAFKSNTVLREIDFIGGQMISHTDSTLPLLTITNPIVNSHWDCWLSHLNPSGVVFDPTGIDTYLQGTFPKSLMECIQVQCNVYWSGIDEKPRDSFEDYHVRYTDASLTTVSQNDNIPLKYGAPCKIDNKGKSISKITGKVTGTNLTNPIFVKYTRAYNGGEPVAATANASATPDEEGNFTFTNVYGMVDSFFIFTNTQDTDNVITNLVITRR